MVLQEDLPAWRSPLLPGVELVLRVDTLSLLFASLSAVLWLVTTIYAIGYLEGRPHRARSAQRSPMCRPPPGSSRVTACTGVR